MTARTVVEQGALALSMDRGTEDWEVEIVASLHRLKMFTDNPPTDIDKRIDTVERVHWRFHLSLIGARSEEHTSELQSLMRITSAVFCFTKTRWTFAPPRIPRKHTSTL